MERSGWIFGVAGDEREVEPSLRRAGRRKRRTKRGKSARAVIAVVSANVLFLLIRPVMAWIGRGLGFGSAPPSMAWRERT